MNVMYCYGFPSTLLLPAKSANNDVVMVFGMPAATLILGIVAVIVVVFVVSLIVSAVCRMLSRKRSEKDFGFPVISVDEWKNTPIGDFGKSSDLIKVIHDDSDDGGTGISNVPYLKRKGRGKK